MYGTPLLAVIRDKAERDLNAESRRAAESQGDTAITSQPIEWNSACNVGCSAIDKLIVPKFQPMLPIPVHDPGRGYHACRLGFQWPQQYERAYISLSIILG